MRNWPADLFFSFHLIWIVRGFVYRLTLSLNRQHLAAVALVCSCQENTWNWIQMSLFIWISALIVKNIISTNVCALERLNDESEKWFDGKKVAITPQNVRLNASISASNSVCFLPWHMFTKRISMTSYHRISFCCMQNKLLKSFLLFDWLAWFKWYVTSAFCIACIS